MQASEAAKDIGNRIWPDVTTEKGARQATLIGAAALVWIAGVYSILCIHLLRGEQIIGGQEPDERNWYFPIVSLIAAAVATSYLAIRVMDHRCPIAAWMGLLWIAFEALTALLGVSTGNPPSFRSFYSLLPFRVSVARSSLLTSRMKADTTSSIDAGRLSRHSPDHALRRRLVQA